MPNDMFDGLTIALLALMVLFVVLAGWSRNRSIKRRLLLSLVVLLLTLVLHLIPKTHCYSAK